MRAGRGDREPRAPHPLPPPSLLPLLLLLPGLGLPVAAALTTGWTRFWAGRRGPAARCSAPPPAAAADASAAPSRPRARPEPRGTPGLRPPEKAPRGSGQPRPGALRAAHARTPAPGRPQPRTNDAGRAQGRALAAAGLGCWLAVVYWALALGVRPLGFLGAARWTDCPHTTRREELGPEREQTAGDRVASVKATS